MTSAARTSLRSAAGRANWPVMAAPRRFEPVRFAFGNTPTPLIVAETGRATALGAQGEIPYLLKPGDTYYYADLSGVNSAFGTLDYNESPPLVFLGQQVTLAELGITTTRAPEREERRVGAAHLNCPHCAGPLELRAPDKTERVTCANCS